MITEDYVSFKLAKLLKEKGFEGRMHTFYTEEGTEMESAYVVPSNFFPIYRPTLQMAMKWLRKKHEIFIRPNTSFQYPIKWYAEIFCYGDNLKTQQDVSTESYESPEQACEAAIKYCLENLI